jgi:hypothetical protein
MWLTGSNASCRNIIPERPVNQHSLALYLALDWSQKITLYIKGETMTIFTQIPIPDPVPQPLPVPEPNPLPTPEPGPPPVPEPNPLPNPDIEPLPEPDREPLPSPTPPPGSGVGPGFSAGNQPTMTVFVEDEFEYKIMVRNLEEGTPLSEEDLNQLGRQGWELAAVLTHGENAHFYFKRLRY